MLKKRRQLSYKEILRRVLFFEGRQKEKKK